MPQPDDLRLQSLLSEILQREPENHEETNSDVTSSQKRSRVECEPRAFREDASRNASCSRRIEQSPGRETFVASDSFQSAKGTPFNFQHYPLSEISEALYVALTTLPPREKEILLCRYRQPAVWTLQALGERFGGISRERVRQIEQNALRKLRKAMIETLTAGK